MSAGKRGGVSMKGFVFVAGDGFFVAIGGGEDSGTKLSP